MNRLLRSARALSCSLLALATSAQNPHDAAIVPKERVTLWNGRDLTGFAVFLGDGSVAPASVWSASSGVLRLDTKANGYLRTKQSFSNYRLHVEWRWPKGAAENSNSGVMVHVQGPDTIWPSSFEAQLRAGNAGQVVGLGLDIPAAPVLNNRKRAPRLAEPSEKPFGEWNSYEIYCRGGTIEVFVNGVRQNYVDQLPVTSGAIALQMEGFPIEFREAWLEPLPAQPADAPIVKSAQTREPLLLVGNRKVKELGIHRIVGGRALTKLKALPTGEGAREVWVSPDGRRAYVGNNRSNSITVVDLDALQVVTDITHPDLVTPDFGILTPDSKTMFVVSSPRNSVFVIDAGSNKVVKELKTPLQVTRRLAFSPDGKQLVVAGDKTDALAVLDLATGQVVRTIEAVGEPRGGLLFLGDGKTLVNASVEHATVSLIEFATGETRHTFGVPLSPQRVLLAADGVGLYVVSRMMDMVMYIPEPEGHGGQKWATTGKHPWGAAISGDKKTIFIANGDDETISVIDTASMTTVATLPAGPEPIGLGLRP